MQSFTCIPASFSLLLFVTVAWVLGKIIQCKYFPFFKIKIIKIIFEIISSMMARIGSMMAPLVLDLVMIIKI